MVARAVGAHGFVKVREGGRGAEVTRWEGMVQGQCCQALPSSAFRLCPYDSSYGFLRDQAGVCAVLGVEPDRRARCHSDAGSGERAAQANPGARLDPSHLGVPGAGGLLSGDACPC